MGREVVNSLSTNAIRRMVLGTLKITPEGLMGAQFKIVESQRRHPYSTRRIGVGSFDFVDGQRYILTGNRIATYNQERSPCFNSLSLENPLGIAKLADLILRLA